MPNFDCHILICCHPITTKQQLSKAITEAYKANKVITESLSKPIKLQLVITEENIVISLSMVGEIHSLGKVELLEEKLIGWKIFEQEYTFCGL